MNFRTGQRVLCINDKYRTYCRYPLKKGLVYTVDGFYRCSCGSLQIMLAEIPGVTNMGCRCNRTTVRRQSYFVWRFIPMEYFEGYLDLSCDNEKKSGKKDAKELALVKSCASVIIREGSNN